MRTGVVIQARLGSRRFPRKVLADLCGKPVLQHVVERCLQVHPRVILAVPESDRVLGVLARRLYVECVYGPEDDVLKRYVMAAMAHDLDIIMRITADCPLLNPELCQKVLNIYHEGDCAYAAIGWPMTFPKGYGCEVFSMETLELANGMAEDQYDREHVTPWMERYLRCRYLTQDIDQAHLSYCVDTVEDLERLRGIMNGEN